MTLKLEIDTKQLVQGLDDLVIGIDQLVKPKALEQISRAVFSITGERFMVDIDNYSRANPKKMHHVYEWGKVGEPSGRLFVLERNSVLNGSLIINAKFLPSRMPVPINPELLQQGKNGKIVTRRSIFADKATVMEEGRSVSFTAKRILSFVGDSGLVFVKPGTQINILHPGGKGVNGAFSEFLLEWYTNNGYSAMDNSGFFEKISNNVSIALNQNNATINTVKRAVSDSIISMGLDQEVIV